MLRVKTKLGKSAIHGVGLFADQYIPKGTVTWEYDERFDTAYTEDETKLMSDVAREQFFHYAYLDKKINKYVLCFDDQRFINHSVSRANIDSTPRRDVANRDIQIGEELFCDYDKYDDTYFPRKGLMKSELID